MVGLLFVIVVVVVVVVGALPGGGGGMRRTLRLYMKTGGRIGDLTESCSSTPDSRRDALSLLCLMSLSLLLLCLLLLLSLLLLSLLLLLACFFVVGVILPCYRLDLLRKKINCKTFYEILHN